MIMEETLNANARAVLDVLQRAENHPTALEVYEMVRRVRPHIGLATVYRALHQLTQQGVIKEVGRDTDSIRYDARTTRHDHAICTECGTLLDLPVEIELSDELVQTVAQEAGIIPVSYEIRIYGKCNACQIKGITGNGTSMTEFSAYLSIADEVQSALREQRPVVALKSTVIAHGLPYPGNIEVAQAMEATIRKEGAIPATIGIVDGRIKIGLTLAEITRLGTAQDVLKVSRRDLAVVLATGKLGATTVAGTMLCASMAGIRFFATGGIGGVHRGAEISMDISADLTELSRTPVLVVCAGAKSILDLDLTLEYLETQGVPVIGWQTDEFPAFYVGSSGRKLAHRADEIAGVAAIARVQWECGLHGLVVGCPIPAQYAMDSGPLEAATEAALRLAREQGIRGSATTPFLLAHVAKVTSGESVAANRALLVNNALWAARFAKAYATMVQPPGAGWSG